MAQAAKQLIQTFGGDGKLESVVGLLAVGGTHIGEIVRARLQDAQVEIPIRHLESLPLAHLSQLSFFQPTLTRNEASVPTLAIITPASAESLTANSTSTKSVAFAKLPSSRATVSTTGLSFPITLSKVVVTCLTLAGPLPRIFLRAVVRSSTLEQQAAARLQRKLDNAHHVFPLHNSA
jgi:hypothetical protein